MLKLLRCFSKTFRHLFWLLYSAEHLFSEQLLLFLLVFSGIDVHKILCKIHRKAPLLEHIFKNVAGIRSPICKFNYERDTSMVFSCDFFKNTIFIEQLCVTAFVTLILVKYDFQLTAQFLPTFVTFQIFH